MISGFNADKSPQLYLTDPAGTYSAWKVHGRPFVLYLITFWFSIWCSILEMLLTPYPSAKFLHTQANAIGGRNEKAVQEFLEKNWTASLAEADAIRLTVKALLEVVDSGSKNMELAVSRYGQPVRILKEEELEVIIADIEREIEEAKKEAAGASAAAGTSMEI